MRSILKMETFSLATSDFIQFQCSNVENLSPQVIRNVAKEVGELCCNPVEGVKIYPSEDDITNIQATIEGPGIDCHVLYF